MPDFNHVVKMATVLRAEGDRPLRFIASTPREDSYGDIVLQNWELKDFLNNPVMPWGHDYQKPPPARAKSVSVEALADGSLALMVVPEFDTDEEAQLIKGKYERGFLSAVSVGFQPMDYQYRWQLSKDDPLYAERGVVFRKSRLLEVSLVTVPANADALAQRSGNLIQQVLADPKLTAELIAHLQLNGLTSPQPVNPISQLFGV